jgi:hypothetical protein
MSSQNSSVGGEPMLNLFEKLGKLTRKVISPSGGSSADQTAPVGENGIMSPDSRAYVPYIAKSLLVAGLAAGFGALYPIVRKRLKKS